MKNTSTEERELHTAQNIINAGTGQSADVEQMCDWFENHPKARNLLTDAELLAGEIASIDPERKERNLARLRTRVRVYKRERMVRWATISVATSAAVVLLCFGIFKYTSMVQPEPELLVASVPVVKDSVPTLIFASGEKMDMTEYAVNKKVIDVVHVAARATDETSSVFNVYKVPRMFTSRLALPDSTIVYLNSDSELSFPSRFSDSVRAVSVRGEAYFEVRHGEVPFVVRANDAEIRVYGTKFNVRAYTEKRVAAVLVEGSIGVEYRGRNVMVRPDELCRVDNINGDISTERVDVSKYIAWTEGMFMFERDRLQDIVSELSRWYGIEIVVEGQTLQNSTITAFFERSVSIDEIMTTIEQTMNVRIIKEEGRYVIR